MKIQRNLRSIALVTAIISCPLTVALAGYCAGLTTQICKAAGVDYRETSCGTATLYWANAYLPYCKTNKAQGNEHCVPNTQICTWTIFVDVSFPCWEQPYGGWAPTEVGREEGETCG